jgi:phospholipid/cholesterol/gamma-HCH transport system substrate-binding protein
MESRREQVFVGIFVLVATALMIFIVFALTGAFAGSDKTYHAKFANAAGLEPGASVRYAGGEKIGHVTKLQIDPANPALIDMSFAVQKDIPVKTDSKVAIMSFSPLGDNHLEIKAGTPQAAAAPSGSQLTAIPYLGFNDLTEQINSLTPQAKELIGNLNARVVQLKTTIDRVNDLINDENRANVSASLADLRGMLKEDRPVIHSALNNVNTASAKISPLIDQLHKTIEQASATLKHVDDIVAENRGDIHASITQLRAVLARVTELTDKLNVTLDDNSENIDQLLLNLRDVSENLKEFTDTIKTRPSSLINSSTPRDRKPGDKP